MKTIFHWVQTGEQKIKINKEDNLCIMCVVEIKNSFIANKSRHICQKKFKNPS